MAIQLVGVDVKMIGVKLSDYSYLKALPLLPITAMSGILAAYNTSLALAVALTILLLLLISGNYSWIVFEAILLFVLAVPTGWGTNNLVQEVVIRSISITPQILLSSFFTALILAFNINKLALPQKKLDILKSPVTKATLTWMFLGALLLVSGVQNHGTIDALRDFQYIFTYLWFFVALFIYSNARMDKFRVVQAIMLGMLIYSFLTVIIYLFPDMLRFAIYNDGMWTNNVRVGFNTSSLLVIFVPLCLALLGSNAFKGGWRLIYFLSATFMLLSLIISQGRVLIACTILNALLVLLGPRLGSVNLGKLRNVFYICLIALVIIGAGAVLVGYGMPQAQELTSYFFDRFMPILNYGTNYSLLEDDLRVRGFSNQSALDRWKRHSIVFGEGLGARLDLYDPAGRIARSGLFIDNIWATLAVKGGLTAILSYGLLLIALFVQFYRAAKHCIDGRLRLVFRSLLFSLPGFIVATTVFSAHSHFGTAVVLVLTTMAAIATISESEPIISKFNPY